MLLGDWYGVTKDVVMRESVMREVLHLFASNEPSRDELARIIIHRGGRETDLEANALLREAVSVSRDHKYAWVELARSFLSSGFMRRTTAKSLRPKGIFRFKSKLLRTAP